MTSAAPGGSPAAPGPAGAQAADLEGVIFDIDTFAIHDGPGIRMAVYLKGCALACAWCHSPESQSRRPELVFVPDRCVLCGSCAAICPQGTHEPAAGRHDVRRDRCILCGRCAERCPSGALVIRGQVVRAGEIIARAVRMRSFFRHSGGGVTLTGGEVTEQPDFAAAILAGCRAEGIATAIETSGACPWQRLERVACQADLILYDLKLMDDAEHRRWTGGSNAPVLDNLRRLAATGADIQVRVPLVPGITDTDGNLRGIFALMGGLGLRRIVLLPFNPLAAAKYEWLGRSCAIQAATQSAERLAEILALALAAGLDAEIG